MKQTLTRTVTYKGRQLHARAVPAAGQAGYTARVLVLCTAIESDVDDCAVELKAWLHGSAEKALQYGLSGGRDWIDSSLIAA
ncbi:MAG: hypothetical protein NVS2B4_02960 [Ramlibacter sp.]